MWLNLKDLNLLDLLSPVAVADVEAAAALSGHPIHCGPGGSFEARAY